jgi:hypothetical protein
VVWGRTRREPPSMYQSAIPECRSRQELRRAVKVDVRAESDGRGGRGMVSYSLTLDDKEAKLEVNIA